MNLFFSEQKIGSREVNRLAKVIYWQGENLKCSVSNPYTVPIIPSEHVLWIELPTEILIL